MINPRMSLRSPNPDDQKPIDSEIQTARHPTPDEVTRDGLELLEQQERQRESAIMALKDRFGHSIEQADRGEFVHPQTVLWNIAAIKNAELGENA